MSTPSSGDPTTSDAPELPPAAQADVADPTHDLDDLADDDLADDDLADDIDDADGLVDDAPPPPAPPTFADLGVQPAIVDALTQVGITHPFPIQAMTLPVALTGHDIIGQAKTGTGKTLGFGIPLLQRVTGPGEPGFENLSKPGAPQALVVTPTRELAVQVAGDLNTAAKLRSARVLTVYGGRAYEPQIEALRKGIEIVVGTPGRLLDLAQQGHLTLGHARIVVLDEADEMLDLGFLPDVERIMSLTPDGRQMMLFSATMPGPVVALARRFMSHPTHIRAADPDDSGATVKATAQFVYRAHALDKVEMIARILQAQGRGLTMIFARTKRSVAKVADELAERGFASAAIHGDLGQGAREQALRAFRNGKVDVLVATDVAARGIDVDDVTHVINYQCPEDEKTYLHRIGRTGRAGNTGTAVTFVDWDDLHRWTMIDKSLDLGIPEPLETYSSSPHLYSDLNIPEGTRGTLPRASRTRAGLDAEVVEDLGETGRGPRGRTGTGGGRGERSARDGSSRDGGRGGRGARSRSGGDDPAAAGSAGRTDGGHTPGEDDGAALDAPRARRTRPRRRTRGGVATDGASPTDGSATGSPAGGGSGGSGSGDAPAGEGRVNGGRAARETVTFVAPDPAAGAAAAPRSGDSPDGADGEAAGRSEDGGPRRRRRRGGRGRGTSTGSEQPAPVEG